MWNLLILSRIRNLRDIFENGEETSVVIKCDEFFDKSTFSRKLGSTEFGFWPPVWLAILLLRLLVVFCFVS